MASPSGSSARLVRSLGELESQSREDETAAESLARIRWGHKAIRTTILTTILTTMLTTSNPRQKLIAGGVSDERVLVDQSRSIVCSTCL